MIDLAWLNLAHWQSASDQRHILHVARVPFLFGRGLSEGEIDLLLANDIAIAVEACNEIFGPGFAGMAEPRRHALISMAFNMGAPRLGGFRRMRAAIATDDWAAAAAEALDSRWAAQTGRRAHDIAALLRSG